MTLLSLLSCKPSDQYSVDNLYPIPVIPIIPNQQELDDKLKIQDQNLQVYVDEFDSYVSSFGTPTLNKGIYYKFQNLSSLSGHVLGQCNVYKNDNIVFIDPTFWATASDWDRRSVVFHELGHCVLGRGHRTFYFEGSTLYYGGGYKPAWPLVSRYLDDGITLNPNYRGDWPISLMHRSIVRQVRFQPEESYYLTELFTSDGTRFLDIAFEDSYLKSDECTSRYGLDGNIQFAQTRM